MKLSKVIFICLFFVSNTKELKSKETFQFDSLKIKISQMLIFGIKEANKVLEEDSLFKAYSNMNLGGIILFEKNIANKRSKYHLKSLTSEIQKVSKIPSFIAIDEEGGNVTRLKPKYGFHKTKTAKYLGSRNNLDSTYYYAKLTSDLLKDLGINMNLAPTIDLEENENNFISKAERSYGRDTDKVYFHAKKFIDAHDENEIITVLKHFPGHGSSSTDTHKEFTDISETWSVQELYPYQNLIRDKKVLAVMTSHVVNKKIDDRMLPATLSYNIIGKLLREFLKFDGVIISDDMQMGAITKYYGLKESIILSINAGVDLLLFSNNQLYKDQVDPNEIISIIEEGVQNGEILIQRINESFKRIQRLKKMKGLIN